MRSMALIAYDPSKTTLKEVVDPWVWEEDKNTFELVDIEEFYSNFIVESLQQPYDLDLITLLTEILVISPSSKRGIAIFDASQHRNLEGKIELPSKRVYSLYGSNVDHFLFIEDGELKYGEAVDDGYFFHDWEELPKGTQTSLIVTDGIKEECDFRVFDTGLLRAFQDITKELIGKKPGVWSGIAPDPRLVELIEDDGVSATLNPLINALSFKTITEANLVSLTEEIFFSYYGITCGLVDGRWKYIDTDRPRGDLRDFWTSIPDDYHVTVVAIRK